MTNEKHSQLPRLARTVLFAASLTLALLAVTYAAPATWSTETLLTAPSVNGSTQIRVANNQSGVG